MVPLKVKFNLFSCNSSVNVLLRSPYQAQFQKFKCLILHSDRILSASGIPGIGTCTIRFHYKNLTVGKRGGNTEDMFFFLS